MIFDFFDKFIDIFILSRDFRTFLYPKIEKKFNELVWILFPELNNEPKMLWILEIPFLGNIASDNFDSFTFKFGWIFSRRIDRSRNDFTSIIFQILS